MKQKEIGKVFNEIAKKNMVEWDFESFVKTHPKLYRTMVETIIYFNSKKQ